MTLRPSWAVWFLAILAAIGSIVVGCGNDARRDYFEYIDERLLRADRFNCTDYGVELPTAWFILVEGPGDSADLAQHQDTFEVGSEEATILNEQHAIMDIAYWEMWNVSDAVSWDVTVSQSDCRRITMRWLKAARAISAYGDKLGY